MRIAVIGAGVSGMTIAKLLSKDNEVVVYERENRPGGLIKCDTINGSLFHRTGGHVFNSKREDVLNWFWKQFDKESEFTKALRNSTIHLNNELEIPYPIENHAYMLGDELLNKVIGDLLNIYKKGESEFTNFEEFLKGRFGETLYNLYFQPYNYKVWRRSLAGVPLTWLEGKLPMPSVQEIIYNNINHIEERAFVHSSFFYPQKGGSQFVANRLSQGLDIVYDRDIKSIERKDSVWIINDRTFDKVVYCGNIKQIPSILKMSVDLSSYTEPIENLEYHGTTVVFCEIDVNKYSWIYLPDKEYESHRIICTGNFSSSNNAPGKMTASIEFTDFISEEEIKENLKRMPYSPHYLSHHYEKYTYPIQNKDTRCMIESLKQKLEGYDFYLLGRFAEWEYYNMDVAMGAALDLYKRVFR
ncbi:NAD(P)-binding protein [Bacteroides caecigallinarum]|nr:NAD(P)-binding protein [Bacteroides caecigallinarum]